MNMKTAQEIQNLKDNWTSDPCWDIEDTTGFEAHRNELRDWRINLEEQQAIKEHNRLTVKAKELMCSLELARYIEQLERRLSRLEDES